MRAYRRFNMAIPEINHTIEDSLRGVSDHSFLCALPVLGLPRPPSLYIACAQVQGLAPDEADPTQYNHFKSPYHANIIGAGVEAKKYVENASFEQGISHIEERISYCHQHLIDQKIISIAKQILVSAEVVLIQGSPEDGLLGYLGQLEQEGVFDLLVQKAQDESATQEIYAANLSRLEALRSIVISSGIV